MSKHTPGPWKTTHSEVGGYRVSDSTGWGVAVVLKDTNDEANARLMAAAPQMFEALETADALIHRLLMGADYAQKEVEVIKAALEAAERGGK